mmetsp:Transcript_26332/g.81834  ORF Transcript_26332/g.81834 Transcript_26332/m.81834 type:complete len:383 (-) Transcript_26332:12-1160(-)
MAACRSPHSGHCVPMAMSSSIALPMTCRKPICRPWIMARRSCNGALPDACAAMAVKGPRALPFVSCCRYVLEALSTAAVSAAARAAASSPWNARFAGSSRPSTASVFSAPCMWPLRRLICESRPKKGQPAPASAAQGTSSSIVSTGEESCSKPEKSCTKATGSSTVAKDRSCRHNLPRPHSSAACGPSASTALSSLSAASMAADMASRLASCGADLPGARRPRKCCFAASQAAARGPAEQLMSSGGSAMACCMPGAAPGMAMPMPPGMPMPPMPMPPAPGMLVATLPKGPTVALAMPPAGMPTPPMGIPGWPMGAAPPAGGNWMARRSLSRLLGLGAPAAICARAPGSARRRSTAPRACAHAGIAPCMAPGARWKAPRAALP